MPRTSRPHTRTEEQKAQELDKIKKYRDLESQLRFHVWNHHAHLPSTLIRLRLSLTKYHLLQVDQGDYSPETFQLTSSLLKLNPEYYTIWNIRRRTLLREVLSKTQKIPEISAASDHPSNSIDATAATGSAPDMVHGSSGGGQSKALGAATAESDLYVLRSELGFTIPLLVESPKCYWIWNYRAWILQQAVDRLDVTNARRIWEEELGLTSRMLTKDRRNFHAWGYRRLIVEKLESSELEGKSMVEAEFEYTTRMIHMDLSNFSAWHNRSRLIPRLLAERAANDQERRDFFDEG